MTVQVDVSNKTIIRVLSLTVLFVLGLWFVYTIRDSLVIIGVSVFLALALNPPVSYLSRALPRRSRGVATGIAYVAILCFIGLVLYSIVPELVRQSDRFVDNVPRYVDELKNGSGFLPDLVDQLSLESTIDQFEDNVISRAGDIGGPIWNGVQQLTSSLISVFTIIVLTFFILVEGPRWYRRLWDLTPTEGREHRERLARAMYNVVTGYVNGQLVLAAGASVSSFLVMFLLGISFAAPLAAIVFVLVLIPMVGATLAAVAVFTISLLSSLGDAMVMLVFFIVYQQVENNVFQPIVQSRSINLSPLLVFIAAILGISVAGILGALVAIPVMASAKILARDYIEYRQGVSEAERSITKQLNGRQEKSAKKKTTKKPASKSKTKTTKKK